MMASTGIATRMAAIWKGVSGSFLFAACSRGE